MTMTFLDVNYVYLIAHGGPERFTGPVKVGMSRYPDKRLASLQTGNPHSLSFVFKFKAPSRDLAMFAEKVFHDVARERRLSGEWFDMSPEFALNTLVKTFMAMVAQDIQDPETINVMLEFSGVWEAANLWQKMQEAADV